MEKNMNHHLKAKTSKKPPTKKGKSLSGRKPGYRMKEWQKEVQLTSIRNRDLDCFNSFLEEFVSISKGLADEKFFIIPDRMDGNLSFPEDHIYIFKHFFRRNDLPDTETLFLYANVNLSYKKICLKAYEQYALLRDRQFFPVDMSVRRSLFDSIRTAVFREGLRFPEQDLICRSLSDMEKEDFMESLPSGLGVGFCDTE